MFNGSALMDFHRKWGHLNFAECCKELGMNQEKFKLRELFAKNANWLK